MAPLPSDSHLRSRSRARRSPLCNAADDERADLGDAFEVTVDVNDPETVVQGGAGDEEVWDGRSVPHTMMVSKVPLEVERSLEQVLRRGDDLECLTQICLDRVIVLCGTCRVELLELAYRTEEQRSSQLGKLRTDSRLGAACNRALVEQPAPYRHISSDASTATSTRRLSCSRY